MLLVPTVLKFALKQNLLNNLAFWNYLQEFAVDFKFSDGRPCSGLIKATKLLKLVLQCWLLGACLRLPEEIIDWLLVVIKNIHMSCMDIYVAPLQ